MQTSIQKRHMTNHDWIPRFYKEAGVLGIFSKRWDVQIFPTKRERLVKWDGILVGILVSYTVPIMFLTGET